MSFGQVDSVSHRPKVDGQFSLGGAHQAGILDLFTFKSTLNADMHFDYFHSNTYLQYAFNNTLNRVIQNDFFGYEIISLAEHKVLHPKIAGMYERSKIKSIADHYVLGAGVGWNAMVKPKHKLVIMNTLSFEEKQFITNTALNYRGMRYSMILKGSHQLFKDHLHIRHNFFLNPWLFNASNNYRYRALIDLLMPLSKRISAKISLDYSNESIVDTGFVPENTLTTFGLSFKLN
jgi:hypothetical protein